MSVSKEKWSEDTERDQVVDGKQLDDVQLVRPGVVLVEGNDLDKGKKEHDKEKEGSVEIPTRKELKEVEKDKGVHVKKLKGKELEKTDKDKKHKKKIVVQKKDIKLDETQGKGLGLKPREIPEEEVKGLEKKTDKGGHIEGFQELEGVKFLSPGVEIGSTDLGKGFSKTKDIKGEETVGTEKGEKSSETPIDKSLEGMHMEGFQELQGVKFLRPGVEVGPTPLTGHGTGFDKVKILSQEEPHMEGFQVLQDVRFLRPGEDIGTAELGKKGMESKDKEEFKKKIKEFKKKGKELKAKGKELKQKGKEFKEKGKELKLQGKELKNKGKALKKPDKEKIKKDAIVKEKDLTEEEVYRKGVKKEGEGLKVDETQHKKKDSGGHKEREASHKKKDKVLKETGMQVQEEVFPSS